MKSQMIQDQLEITVLMALEVTVITVKIIKLIIIVQIHHQLKMNLEINLEKQMNYYRTIRVI